MLIYYILLSVIGIFCVIETFSDRKFANSIASLVPIVLIFLIMALRADTVGTDLVAYKSEYESNDYFLINQLRGWELGFSYLINLLRMLQLPFQALLVTISAILLHSLYILYKNYSKNILLSFILFICFGIFAFSMSGLRQTLAIAFSVYAIVFLLKDRNILFFVFILLASSFHQSALLMIFTPLVKFFNLTKSSAITYILASVGLFFIPYDVIIERLIGLEIRYFMDYFEYDSTINPLVILFNYALSIIVIIFSPSNFFDSKSNKFFYFLILINLAIYSITIYMPMVARVNLYLSIYLSCLLPNALASMQFKKLQQTSILACIFFAILYFSIVTPGDSVAIDNYEFLKTS